MAQIRGNTQIISGTITSTQISATAGITNSQMAAWNQSQSAGGFALLNLLDGVNASDAATMNNLRNFVNGLSWKNPVKMAYTSNLATISGLVANDGYTPVAGDRILLTAQTTGSANLIYVASAGAWTVALDSNTASELPYATTQVENGTVNGGKTFTQTVQAITYGTTSLAWVQGPGIQSITFTNGLLQTGLTVNVVAGDSSLLSTAGSLKVNVDNLTLATGSTLAVKNAGITSTQLAASVAGGGLTGGAGSALTVRKKVDSTLSGLTGAVNSSNTSYTLSSTPSPAGIEDIYLNGLLLLPTTDYTISAGTVTTVVVPQTGDTLVVKYPY